MRLCYVKDNFLNEIFYLKTKNIYNTSIIIILQKKIYKKLKILKSQILERA